MWTFGDAVRGGVGKGRDASSRREKPSSCLRRSADERA
jgi:hypothetical protein